jgi:hypothetical protein
MEEEIVLVKEGDRRRSDNGRPVPRATKFLSSSSSSYFFVSYYRLAGPAAQFDTERD